MITTLSVQVVKTTGINWEGLLAFIAVMLGAVIAVSTYVANRADRKADKLALFVKEQVMEVTSALTQQVAAANERISTVNAHLKDQDVSIMEMKVSIARIEGRLTTKPIDLH